MYIGLLAGAIELTTGVLGWCGINGSDTVGGL